MNLNCRIVSVRKHGKIAFAKFKEISNKSSSENITQAVFMKQNLADYDTILSTIKVGCIVTFSGEEYVTSTGVLSLNVESCQIHYVPDMGFPSEHFGIENENIKRRHRFLDCLYNDEVKNLFVKRAEIIKNIRNFLNEKSFLEFETPILSASASGAMARPFETYYNALDKQFFMRIAPETFLKRLLAAGYSDVFEIGKNFRNEGIDPSHLQEFTVVEWYSAFKDYKDNLELFLELLNYILADNKNLVYKGHDLDFGNIKIVSYLELFEKYAPDYDPFSSDASEKKTDLIFKTKIRPNLVQPVIVMDYPSYVSPMAKRSQKNSAICEQWQFIVAGLEIVKCYTEIVDSTLQRQLLLEQVKQKNDGDLDTMDLEEDFLYTMDYGIPPCSGLGIGIDRMVALLTNTASLRDVVFFPAVI